MREEWRYATFSERWGADFIDSLIMTAVGIPAYFLIDVPLSREEAVGATEIAWLCWFLWNWTYLVGTTGQSWGRRIAGLQVIMRWVLITALGNLVEPDVNRNLAMVSPVTA